MNILIVEDEQDIRELLQLHLIKEGYDVYEAEDGVEAIKIFESNKVDLILLDIMLPKLDGFKVLNKIREKSEVPVIFLTARLGEGDKILGLGLGGDDYIVKPFNTIEVIARVQALLRRTYKYGISHKNEIINGELRIDKDSCAVYKNDIQLDLNAKEYKILEMFMDNIGKVHTKKQIYENVWGDPYYEDDNTIMVHISHIRDKVENNPKDPKYLKTIRGIGYKMEKIEYES
ncbi:response regulator transcription factor [uncultured Clostridium sp.]|uniref:response regulator transcription factor n=1 Tax=uncultured Clostridium sp. TaxID=59620 RepID=UPI0028E7E464|nr:response regulator transcription factor [uncultured Clostridium sp.]